MLPAAPDVLPPVPADGDELDAAPPVPAFSGTWAGLDAGFAVEPPSVSGLDFAGSAACVPALPTAVLSRGLWLAAPALAAGLVCWLSVEQPTNPASPSHAEHAYLQVFSLTLRSQ
jgi:hypothetical protein